MRKINVVTLCDGISCGQLSLTALGIPYNYIAVEPDSKCKSLVKARFPNTIQFDYVEDVTGQSLCDAIGGQIDLVMLSAPCQDISVLGNGKGMATVHGYPIRNLEDYLYFKNRGYEFTRSATFWEGVRVYRELLEINPNVALVNENVVNGKWTPTMLNALGGYLEIINSSKFLPQNRKRAYVTSFPISNDFPTTRTPLTDIIPNAVSGFGWSLAWDEDEEGWLPKPRVKCNNEINCITTQIAAYGKAGYKWYIDKDNNIHPLTVEHLEALQGLPIGYTNLPGLTDKDRHHMIGNGWTIPVIVHILKSGLPLVLQTVSTLQDEII